MPEFLFEDAEIVERVKNHPMALWKCKEQIGYAEVTGVKKQESMMALWKNSFDERHIVVYN